MKQSIAIVGGGAAGCFCAIEVKRRLPSAQVTVFEAGSRLLAKVAVTGGGRCNLTNTFEDVRNLRDAYPRGEQLMKRALRAFSREDTMRWFEAEGVRLTVQPDRCVFPVSQDAMQIVRTLEGLLGRLGVRVCCNSKVVSVAPDSPAPSWKLIFEDKPPVVADRVVVTTGGATAAGLKTMFAGLGLKISAPVPSLFTFKIPEPSLHALMGTVVEGAVMSLAGTNFRSEGTLLLTDWGVSGPATLRLSSYAARHLAERQYCVDLVINWTGLGESEVRASLTGSGPKFVANTPVPGLTERLWRYLVARAGIRADCRWSELGSKGRSRLTSVLTADTYPIRGRARFKEEFVTCGGVSLDNVNISTLESKVWPGLFFAGEVLDIDAVTGGFNLQAAWSTGICAARNMTANLSGNI